MSSNSRKRKRTPKSFIDTPSLSSVLDFPARFVSPRAAQPIETPVASELVTTLFLERFEKEVLRYLRSQQESCSETQKSSIPTKSNVLAGTKGHLTVGTNQCLRRLDRCLQGDCPNQPLLVVAVRNTYGSPLLSQVPPSAKKLGVPFLLLPGNASQKLGDMLGIRKVTILLICQVEGEQASNTRLQSFVDYVVGLADQDEKKM